MNLPIFSPTRTRLLPDPQDTYFYPGRPYYDNRSRTKENEEEERMKNADLIIFFIYFLLPTQKFQKNQNLFEKTKILVIY